jgi:uncharacterized protein YerC
MKKKKTDLTDKEIMKTLDTLYTAVSMVKGRDAVKLFLRDLLTESERLMLGRRLMIARLLLRRVTYDEVRRRLGVGYATIARVERWLQDEFPGYEQALAGLEKEMDKRAVRAEIANNPFSYAALKKKYPLHFLLADARMPRACGAGMNGAI